MTEDKGMVLESSVLPTAYGDMRTRSTNCVATL